MKGSAVEWHRIAIAEMRTPRTAISEMAELVICWELVVAHLRGEGSAPVNAAARDFLELLTFFET